MATYDVTVQVLEKYDSLVPERLLRRVAEVTLAADGVKQGASVSVVVAGDDVVRDLNRRHRGLDETTDVLAFSFDHEGRFYGENGPDSEASAAGEFVLPPGESAALGEVIISYPQARLQAAQAGHAVDRELALLLAHGVLHLLGHDHEEPAQHMAMKKIEALALDQVF